MLTQLLAVGVLASGALAHPKPETGLARRDIDLTKFALEASPTYVNSEAAATEKKVTIVKNADYVQAAKDLVKQLFPGATYELSEDHYVGANGVAHVNFKQTAHGIVIDNADFNVNVDKDGSIFSYGHSFYSGKLPEASPLQKRDFVRPEEAIKGVAKVLGLPVQVDGAAAEPKEEKEVYGIKNTSGTRREPNAKLTYFVKPDGTLALAWRVETDIGSHWLQSYIDANTNSDVFGVADWVSQATYEVFPWPQVDPTKGGRIVVTDPWDKTASEFGWHSDGKEYKSTHGNNGVAVENSDGNRGATQWQTEPQAESAELKFEYPYAANATDFKTYTNASITQLFYTANMFHDLVHSLGFNEAAGNFETNNGNAGGKGNDMVILNSQDGTDIGSKNNAYFISPPDGTSGEMHMYMWDTATPKRDGSFEAGVVIHEYGHGVSNRLTGGPANANCLSNAESGGMGEGWSDFFATAIRTNEADTRNTVYPMGEWVINRPNGIRQYPYATDLKINPLTYKSANSMNGAVHAIGTVWATMLYEVLWNIIDAKGNTDDIRPTFDDNGVPTDGRYTTLKLVIDGLAL